MEPVCSFAVSRVSAFAAEARTVVRPVSGTRLQRTDVESTHFSLFVLNHNLFAVALPGPQGVFIRKYQSVVCRSALFRVLIFFGRTNRHWWRISRCFSVLTQRSAIRQLPDGRVSGAATSTTTGI